MSARLHTGKVDLASPYPKVAAGCVDQRRKRSVDELDRLLQQRDRRKQKTDIFDTEGKAIGAVAYDPQNGDIISIDCRRFMNVAGTAERLEEFVYCTDEQGNITDERLTRGQAREGKKRYLIVTTLLFQGNKMLVQKRSQQKKFDAGKLSTSAHGVAKELYSEDHTRITNGPVAALVNSAVEINEELRHDAEPFAVKVWPGTHDELLAYADTHHLDDSNTIWLVPEAYIPKGGYPLGSVREKRTRALSAGFIFSTDEPSLSIDRSELEECRWEKVSQVFKEPDAARDLVVLWPSLRRSSKIRRWFAVTARSLQKTSFDGIKGWRPKSRS